MIYLDEYESPVGRLSLASDGDNLCGLWLENQKYFQEKLELRLGVECINNRNANRVEGPHVREISEGIRLARSWLDAYFSGENPGDLPPIKMQGTNFQEKVWSCLTEIQYGKLVTYGDIANQIEEQQDKKCSPRAVGVAVGRNPISIIVPCHRVIGSNKSLTGYAGGIARKIQLLQLEGIDTDVLRIPTKGTAL